MELVGEMRENRGAAEREEDVVKVVSKFSDLQNTSLSLVQLEEEAPCLRE